MFSPKYNKNLTGAEITFQPEDINLYSEDPFDVQITIGYSPLEDGYYFTVKDPKLKDFRLFNHTSIMGELEDFSYFPSKSSNLV